ncbi:hypothetical protein BOX15_Mlig018467g2, partial [Macrostomum lignano]
LIMDNLTSSIEIEGKRKRYFDDLYQWINNQRKLMQITASLAVGLNQFGSVSNSDASAAALANAHLQSQLRLIKGAAPTQQGQGGQAVGASGLPSQQQQQQQQPQEQIDRQQQQQQARRANPRQVYGGRLGIEGYRFRVAPIWKRVLAELIDGLLLLVLKLVLMIVLEQRIDFVVDSLLPVDNRFWKAEPSVGQQQHHQRRLAEFNRRFGASGGGHQPNQMHHQQQHQQNLEFDIAGMRFSMTDLLSPRLILLDLMVRLMVLLLETFALCGFFGLFRSGQTPGKWLMNLQVVQANDVIDLPDQIIEVLPANPLRFQRALARSAIKNLAMMFFFPVWATAFVFSNHRTSYDIITSTIVVENLPPEN